MAIPPGLAIALVIGVPASGEAISLYMIPEVFRGLNDVLPLPAALDVVRATVYSDGSGIGDHLAPIVGWGAACLLLNVVIDRWLTHLELTSDTDEDGCSSAPAAGQGTALALTDARDTAERSRRGRKRTARTRSWQGTRSCACWGTAPISRSTPVHRHPR